MRVAFRLDSIRILSYCWACERNRLAPRALRQLRKIDVHTSRQIRSAIDVELVDLAKATNVKALADHAYGYRLRVGSYRVLFDYDGAIRIVAIQEVRKRNERTY